MKLYWQKTKFTWIASKTQFETKSRAVIEDGTLPPDNISLLCERLLEYGGEQVCVRYPDLDLDLFLKHGKLYPTSGLEMQLGEDRECHSNSSALWMRHKKLFSICTGYGLTNDDEMWRQHTWLVKRKSREIVETTIRRDMYFGITLGWLKSFLFASANMMEL